MTKEEGINRFTFRVPEKLMKEIKRVSRKHGVSANSFILKIIWDWYEK